MVLLTRYALILALLLLQTSDAAAEQILHIKYRTTTVDVDRPYFEYLDTSKSSWVRGAWYDSANKYMVINLKGTNYHYCGLSERTWNLFKGAASFGSTYVSAIKGNFDCRINPVPSYPGK